MHEATNLAASGSYAHLGKSDNEIVVPKWPKIELTSEFKEDIHKAFSLFDETGEGTVSVDAVRVAFRALGYDTDASEFKELRQQTKEYQSRVDFGEFLSLLTDRMLSLDSDMNIMKSFELLDQGNKGYIDLDDLRQAAAKLELPEMYDDDFAAMLLGGQVNDTAEELQQFYEDQQRRARIRKGKAYGAVNNPPELMLSSVVATGGNVTATGLPGFQRARRLSSSGLPSPESLTVNLEQFRCLMQMTRPPAEDRRLI
ncbi:Centrin-2 [Fasciola gigantica]|uniref:Centrin-2 n=1 Tax=Fasciola gigantica TaxID=46835 RepID=A0A504WYB5_FASGI|nr:Centrin-2 [Fasciola gigantica]